MGQAAIRRDEMTEIERQVQQAAPSLTDPIGALIYGDLAVTYNREGKLLGIGQILTNK